jgi:hypothetical protein
MALVGLGGEEKFEGDVGGGWGVIQEGVRFVVRLNLGSQFSHVLGCGSSAGWSWLGWGGGSTLLLVQVVLFSDILGGKLGGAVGLGVDRGHGLLEVGVELGLYRLDLLEAVVGSGLDRLGLGGEKSLQRAERRARVSCECPGGCRSCQ